MSDKQNHVIAHVRAVEALIAPSIEAEEWGDVRSMLDEYFPYPESGQLMILKGSTLAKVSGKVVFYWGEQDGWYYDDEPEKT
jgi:hypothetical protein